jgi:hypothetical protein
VAGRIRRILSTSVETDAIRIGWVERVSLPELGLWGLAAKVDTGARTSALHVRSVEPIVDGEHSEAPRSLFIVLPPLGGAGERRLVRVVVKDWIEVRDTSGRRELRPVVETQLELGPLRRTIRLTLTDRGDMRYQMLVGRTAIPPGVLVDPGARFLLRALEAVPSRAQPAGRPVRRSVRRSQAKI